MQHLVGSMVAGRYDVLALVGAGGMGAVYRAHDRELDEVVALKVIRTDRASHPAMVEQFRHEVKLARRVTHVNIARTFELGLSDGMLYCTMELVEGESLRARMARARTLPQPEAAAIARALCGGLEVAHAAGVIHRDIKPDNVLLTPQGRVVLADFGVATITEADTGGYLAGTLEYMAPEQARGEAPTPAADIYAVGVVLFEMLSGARAFAGSMSDILLAKQQVDKLDLALVPEGLRGIVDKATAFDPAQRFASAHELAEALAPWAGTSVATAPARVTADELATVVVLAPRGDEAKRYLVEGVHHALLKRLSQLPRVRVWPRTERVEGDAPHVILDTDAAGLLSATVEHGGRSTVLRLPLDVARLGMSAATIVTAVTDALATQSPPASLELLLRARSLQHGGFKRAREAVALLREAHAQDPDDAAIAAELAAVLIRFHFVGAGFEDAFTLAPSLVRRALTAAPHLAESHVAAAHLELHLGDPIIAANEFRTAITCSPFLAEPHEGLGRMLLEAGFVADALPRIAEALAISPTLSTVQWEVARAYALDQNWPAFEALVAHLREHDDRPLARFRFALWRGEHATLGDDRVISDTAFESDFFGRVFDCIVNDKWATQGRAIREHALRAHWPSKRRNTFVAQIGAEVAGFMGDDAVCLELLRATIDLGIYDHHWFARVPLPASVRGTPEYARLESVVHKRALAIHDALFRDRPEYSETLVSAAP